MDPCAFRLVSGPERKVVGMIFTHVDDLMIMEEIRDILPKLQQAIENKFPVDDWEADRFEYVGCEHTVSKDEVSITQSGYAESRLNKMGTTKMKRCHLNWSASIALSLDACPGWPSSPVQICNLMLLKPTEYKAIRHTKTSRA